MITTTAAWDAHAEESGIWYPEVLFGARNIIKEVTYDSSEVTAIDNYSYTSLGTGATFRFGFGEDSIQDTHKYIVGAYVEDASGMAQFTYKRWGVEAVALINPSGNYYYHLSNASEQGGICRMVLPTASGKTLGYCFCYDLNECFLDTSAITTEAEAIAALTEKYGNWFFPYYPRTTNHIFDLAITEEISPSDGLQLGCASSQKITFSLENSDGDFDNILDWYKSHNNMGFMLAMSTDDEDSDRIEKGNYVLKSSSIKQNGNKAEITCYDRMSLADDAISAADLALINVYQTILSLVQKVADHIGVELADDTFRGYTLRLTPALKDGTTWRQCLQWAVQGIGSNARIDHNGELLIFDYNTATTGYYEPIVIEQSENLSPITITGVRAYKYGKADNSVSGSEGYILNVGDNPFIKSTTTATNVAQRWKNHLPAKIVPFEMTILSNPALEPNDLIKLGTDSLGNAVYSICTAVDYKQGYSTVRCDAKTAEEQSTDTGLSDDYGTANYTYEYLSDIFPRFYDIELQQNETFTMTLPQNFHGVAFILRNTTTGTSSGVYALMSGNNIARMVPITASQVATVTYTDLTVSVSVTTTNTRLFILGNAEITY